MHSLNNIIDGDYMAVLCRDMHALGGGGAGGPWALHVQYVVSIANSAVGAAVYGLADCLAVGLAWLGWVAVYNPVACLLSVRTAAASPKVLTASLCIQILGMRQCHTISLYIFLFSCYLLLSFFEFLSFFFCSAIVLAAHSHSTLISGRILASRFYSLSMPFGHQFGPFCRHYMVEFIFCTLFYGVLVSRSTAPVPPLCGVG